ncbi:Uncharacterized membrane protein YhaH, DUF805 family [Nonlabens sp. Hel1_33_55]|uniref:DUF805 domain-containing protein n=1 Tax=Nonlabens sp. Hel1_33_55 TaxID=1336802 RepID=UPI000875EA37|nr:DUF805 domain-containing protein [Nonlabens sp. Hel1_33_55]SCX96638.1 Uncharacterized membrane protein YhaH, DUF805 family [Nonlabens sp. Hel1_33_55]
MSDLNQPASNSNYQPTRHHRPEDGTVASKGMMDYVKTCFNKYADFNGRARRSEFWYFYLFNIIVFFALYIPVIALLVAESDLVILPGILLGIYGLGVILPTLAVIVRRLHDTGRSGWYYLMALIPLVGNIILLIFWVEDSKPGTNEWGPNPKAMAQDNFENDAFV